MEFKIYNLDKYNSYSTIKILKGKREINRLLKKHSVEQEQTKCASFTKEALQCYLLIEDDKWLAIDNHSREFYIEEFHSLENAIRYVIYDDNFILDEKVSKQIKKLVRRYMSNRGKFSLVCFNE